MSEEPAGLHLPLGWGDMFFLYVGECQVTCRHIPGDSLFHKYDISIASGKIHTHMPGKVSCTETKLGVIDRGRLLSKIVMNLCRYKVTSPVVRGSQEAAIHPLQIWMHLLGFRKI